MKGMWIIVVGTLVVVAAVAATPAGAAGNSANAKLCQKDGWKALHRGDGSAFANQGDCVSYGAKGNTILTEPPNSWQAACEQAGGTFSVSNLEGEIPPPGFGYFCTPASIFLWNDVLSPICKALPDVELSGWSDPNADLSNGTAYCIFTGTT